MERESVFLHKFILLFISIAPSPHISDSLCISVYRLCLSTRLRIVARRPGDIGTCYADPAKAHAELKWSATATIDEMCADAWRWQSQNPFGYDAAPADK